MNTARSATPRILFKAATKRLWPVGEKWLLAIKSSMVSGGTPMGSSDIPDEDLTKAVREVFDLRPYFISKRLDLKRPIYKPTSCYGHFGRERPEFTWERTDAAADLKTALKL